MVVCDGERKAGRSGREVWSWCGVDTVSEFVDGEGTVLFEESKETGRAWSSLQPHHDRRVRGILLHAHINVEQLDWTVSHHSFESEGHITTIYDKCILF